MNVLFCLPQIKKYLFLSALLHGVFVLAQTLPPFKPENQPIAPDYANPQHWLTLPFRTDGADVIPKNEKWISDSLKPIDVFYIYPTLFDSKKVWCADVEDKKLNKRLSNLPVKYQATVFNRVGRVYTPLYRQGTIKCFSDTTGNGSLALDLAYEDVKRAFSYYMENYNNDRPIIIASHSQGTRHSRQLLKDFFDSPEMKEKLVCAYIIGYGIYPENYQTLQPCLQPQATNCYVTWASFKDKYIAQKDTLLYGEVCINPISWNADSGYTASNCGILLNMNRKKPYRTECRLNGNYLWVKSKIPFVQGKKVLHLVDYNLFWFEIRKNAELRAQAFLKKLSR